jgi:hypothetical protein
MQEMVNDESGLLRAVNIQACLLTLYLDLHLHPLTRHKINISLIFTGKLLAQSVPSKLWNGDVLNGFTSYDGSWLLMLRIVQVCATALLKWQGGPSRSTQRLQGNCCVFNPWRWAAKACCVLGSQVQL